MHWNALAGKAPGPQGGISGEAFGFRVCFAPAFGLTLRLGGLRVLHASRLHARPWFPSGMLAAFCLPCFTVAIELLRRSLVCPWSPRAIVAALHRLRRQFPLGWYFTPLRSVPYHPRGHCRLRLWSAATMAASFACSHVARAPAFSRHRSSAFGRKAPL